ncbi:MAG: hypothetical protein PVH41_07585 [Anaerolineae bacterium]
MAKPCHGSRFLREALHETWLLRLVRGQYLDGDVPVDGGLLGFVHGGHAPSSGLYDDSIPIQAGAYRGAHCSILWLEGHALQRSVLLARVQVLQWLLCRTIGGSATLGLVW